jgi:beta-N-acetylhexosaminidase
MLRFTAMRERWLLLLGLLLLMTPAGRSQKIPAPKPRRGPRDARWVESTLKKMTLREKLGQLLFVNYFGEFTSTESAEYQELVRQVQENHVGGLVIATHTTPLGIVRSQVYPTIALTNQLQRLAKVPLLVAADFETGTAMRLDEGTSFPSAMAVAATGNPQDAYTVGKMTALEARAVGVRWIFAPDADVNVNPDNPIINIRSFGEDPQRVAQFVTEFVRGVQDNGVLATAKHFPGHGDTNVDSHLALPVVSADRERLEKVELVPFRAAISAGVAAIMPGHLEVPAIEPDPTVPATLSPRLLTGLLRKDLGFDGLIVTDALDMSALTSLYSPGEAAVRAITAGANVLIYLPSPDAALAALEEAVNSGRLPMECVDDSVRRVLAAKASLGLEKKHTVDGDKFDSEFGRPEFAAAALDIADRGVTLLRDRPRLLPLDATKPQRVLLAVISGDTDPVPGADLERELRWRADSLQVLRADTRFNKVEALNLPSPESYDIAIAALFVRVADSKGNVALPEGEIAFVNQLLAAGKPVVVACFGSPYLIEQFPTAQTWLAVFSTNDVAQRAAGRALFGQTPIGGQIPVTVPGAAKLGDGLRVAASPMTLETAPARMDDQLQPAFDVLTGAVADGAFPGGVLAVGYQDKLAIHPFGKLTYDAKAAAVTPDTMYDLASLTKPIATTSAIMLLVAQGRLKIDAPVSRYLPEWADGPNREWRAQVTVRQLLLHTSGLPAHRNYYLESKGKAEILKRIFTEPLAAEPGTRVEYSDLGFILLGEIVERLTGKTLDRFVQGQLFASLGMGHSLFNPPKSLRARIAPTEDDTTYRRRQLQGEVHDQNAWAMGGVAGQAGLFSTAGDLAVFAQMLLNGGIYAHRRVFTRAEIDQFTASENIGDSARTLGWDVPTEPSSTGNCFSPRSFGHNGYTGTSLWIDPEKDLFVILLTNRVYPTVANEKIRQVRPALHDAVVQALGFSSKKVATR